MKKIFYISMFLILAACQHTEHSSPIHHNPNHLSQDQHGKIHESTSAATPEEMTHQVNFETPYYAEGPQQDKPADGTLPVGTKVKLIEPAGSYAFVITESGVKGYVLVQDLDGVPQQ